jgi:ATP-dependent DNA ligase
MWTTSMHAGGLLEVACAHDLGGIVAKLASGRYHADGTSTSWLRIKNFAYTQMTTRHELFDRRAGSRKRRPMLRVP